jgi:hypothetical protein
VPSASFVNDEDEPADGFVGRDHLGALPGCVNLVSLQLQQLLLEDELADEAFEEARMWSHFQLLVITEARARTRAEAALCSTFLRTHATELESLGLTLPQHLQPYVRQPNNGTSRLGSQVHCAVDTWLQLAPSEHVTTFWALWSRQSTAHSQAAAAQRDADASSAADARAHALMLRSREVRLTRERWANVQRRRADRLKRGTDEPDTSESALFDKTLYEVRCVRWWWCCC